MKYVFFDIECACVYKTVAKICAFGYVVTDESFREKERREILINPKGKFHLTGRRGGGGLVLPYEYEDFKQDPLFPEIYPRIKALLEAENTLVCGHATRNDVNYLNLETRRYKLPSFRFAFHDTQFLYMNMENAFSRQYGLQTMAESLGVEFTPHRAVDDAYATMRVCEAICRRERTGLNALISRYGVLPGRVADYRIETPHSAQERSYHAMREQEREQRAKTRDAFFRFVNKNMPRRRRGGSLDGKVFCFARELEDGYPDARKLLAEIFACGGTYTSHPAECNVYIGRAREGTRCQNALDAGAAFIPLDALERALETV